MYRVTIARSLFLAAVLWSGAALAPQAVSAGDIDAVSDKLDRVERDLRELQYEVYKGHPPAAGAPGGAPGSSAASAARLNDLEETLRELRGQVESLAFQVKQMNEQLEFARKETNFRLGALEGGAPAASVSAPPLPASPGAPKALKVSPDTGSNQGARQPGSLGSIPADAVEAAEPAATPRQQYDAAVELLSRAQYAEAQSAFKSFVAANPKDDLTGPAQYWVGEISFTQKDYKNAAVAFADVLKRFSKTPKAPEAMLKLGLSLFELNKKTEACTTLGAVKGRFPNAPKAVLDRAAKRFAESKCAAG